MTLFSRFSHLSMFDNGYPGKAESIFSKALSYPDQTDFISHTHDFKAVVVDICIRVRFPARGTLNSNVYKLVAGSIYMYM